MNFLQWNWSSIIYNKLFWCCIFARHIKLAWITMNKYKNSKNNGLLLFEFNKQFWSGYESVDVEIIMTFCEWGIVADICQIWPTSNSNDSILHCSLILSITLWFFFLIPSTTPFFSTASWSVKFQQKINFFSKKFLLQYFSNQLGLKC